MNPTGILLFGYDRQQADTIKESLDGLLKKEIFLISASHKEDWKIIDILEQEPGTCFEEKNHKVCMFLGFSREQIDTTLKGFPKEKGIARPLFCVPTQHNLQWRFEKLQEHLLEEQRRMTPQTG